MLTGVGVGGWYHSKVYILLTLILFLIQVVFERIMLEPKDITAQLRARRKTKHDAAAAVAAGEADELVYLYQCYIRCQQQQHEFKVRWMHQIIPS